MGFLLSLSSSQAKHLQRIALAKLSACPLTVLGSALLDSIPYTLLLHFLINQRSVLNRLTLDAQTVSVHLPINRSHILPMRRLPVVTKTRKKAFVPPVLGVFDPALTVNTSNPSSRKNFKGQITISRTQGRTNRHYVEPSFLPAVDVRLR